MRGATRSRRGSGAEPNSPGLSRVQKGPPRGPYLSLHRGADTPRRAGTRIRRSTTLRRRKPRTRGAPTHRRRKPRIRPAITRRRGSKSRSREVADTVPDRTGTATRAGEDQILRRGHAAPPTEGIRPQARGTAVRCPRVGTARCRDAAAPRRPRRSRSAAHPREAIRAPARPACRRACCRRPRCC
jgi:hypothetical protein